MRDPKYDTPPVRVSESGVHYVGASDILNSRVGREQIRKTAEIAPQKYTGTAEYIKLNSQWAHLYPGSWR